MDPDETHSGHEEHEGHGAHAGHAMEREPAAPVPPDAQAQLSHLEEMRKLQTLLDRERAAELGEQRRHDAHAQHLMVTDPKGHIEMMKPLQERAALVRDLPEALLTHEAEVYQDLTRARSPDPGVEELGHGVLMAHHVLMEHWVHIAVMPLGAWLLFSPTALAYGSAPLAWSDMISGALVILFGVLSMRGMLWAPWANTLVGLWVAFAPLAFWARSPAAYANDTLIGTLVIAFSVIIPMRTEMPGPDAPPGWSYNPSTWRQRAPVIVLAVLSFFLSRYMASFQLGHIPAAWDPLFESGTQRVLTSDVSRAFPISDAGLGAYTYILELLSALMGDRRRWRTMPWMVAMFGIIVVPLGITSTVLVMLQPVAVGAWCTICLLTALFMLIMVAVSLDEIVAMIQFLILGKRAGRSAWRLFWIGGNLAPRLEDVGLARTPQRSWAEMFWGAAFSWPLLAATLAGAWVMASPWVFGTRGPALAFESILGALAVVVAFIAWAEVTRAARFLNVLIGLTVAAGIWLFPDVTAAARLSDLIAGALLAALSVPRGPVRDRYGGWDPLVV